MWKCSDIENIDIVQCQQQCNYSTISTNILYDTGRREWLCRSNFCKPKQQIYILIRIKMDVRLWTIHEGESNSNLKYFYLLIYWTQKVLQNIMDDMVCWSMTNIQICGYFIHCYAAIFLHDGFNCCNGLWCHYSAFPDRSRRICYRTNAVHELPSPLAHLL